MVKRPSPIDVIKGVIEVEGAVGEFIANGPDGGLPGWVRDQYRKRCDQFANLPPWARALGNAPAGSLGRICDPWYNGRGFDGPEIPPPPFAGGQCQQVGYQVFLTGFDSNSGTQATADRSGLGPVGGTCFVSQGFGNSSIGVLFNGVCEISGGGTATTGTDFTGTWSIVNVVRVDGMPDDCGDPPTELEPGPVPPPDPGPTDGPEPTPDPRDPTGIPFLPIPPWIDPIGGPFPIEAQPIGGEPVGPDDIPGNPDSQPGGGENVGGPIQGGGGAEPGGNDINFGEPPAGRAWVGALFEFNVPASYGSIPGSAPGNLVVPRVFANCSLTYDQGRGAAHRVNSANIDLFRPNGALKVTGVYVNSSPGITYNVRPVSLELCPENNCGAE